MTARRGPERDSPWEISRVLVTPKHEGIGIGKTMIDFHREEFAELEATFKYKDDVLTYLSKRKVIIIRKLQKPICAD